MTGYDFALLRRAGLATILLKFMDKFNAFFIRLYSNPALLWRLVAAVIFLVFGASVFLIPSLSEGLSPNIKIGFGLLLLFYGIFRFITFYFEYKRLGKDE